MKNDVLTDQFSFVKPPKIERNFRDLGFTKKKQATRRKKRKRAFKGRSVLKFSLPKEKTRSQLIKILDKLYSDYIKEKAKGKCFKCGLVKKNAGISHFYSRKNMSTRWDNDNCDWACWGCHFYHLEHFKQSGQFYERYLIKKLGKEGFSQLVMKSQMITKYSTVDIKLLITNFSSIWI